MTMQNVYRKDAAHMSDLAHGASTPDAQLFPLEEALPDHDRIADQRESPVVRRYERLAAFTLASGTAMLAATLFLEFAFPGMGGSAP